ncbi:tape measure protein [Pseudomonas sp. UBA6323]|uniref:tape measure protein n=1 Tax=Pseudomonas sp. UBA6323 TaxID=1947329 RepID=UPI0025F8C63A|nr:tape measure protein [Pseudomonas sp. UBA6323]
MAQEVNGLLIQIEATTAQMRRQLAQGESAISGFTKKMDGRMKSVDAAFDRAGKSAQSAMNIMRSAIAIAAGAGALGSVIKQADAYGQMASRIKMVTADTAEYYAVQKRLMEISDRTYKPIQEQQELFIRSSKAMKELGYSTAETIDFIDSASSSLTINAANADSGRRAIDALSKSMVTGVVRGDEWKAVLDTMPTAVSDIAKHLGITETAVKQMASSGKLSMDTFVKAMIGAREANAQLAEQMPTTVGDAMTRLGNHFASVVGEINEAQGATAGFAEMINGLSDTLADGEFVAGAIEGFTNWTSAVSVISGEISALSDQVNQFTGDMTGSSFSIGEAFSQMPVNLRAAVQIAVVEIAHFIDGVVNKAEAAGAYLRALPSGLDAASQAYDSVRAQMQANDSARDDSIQVILAERDALLATGKAAGEAYLAQHNANTKISTERTAAVKQLTEEERKAADQAAKAAKKRADAQIKAIDDLIARYDPAARAQAQYEKSVALADKALRDGTYTTEQYQKVIQGLYADLNKSIWDKHNKDADEAAAAIKRIDDAMESVRDRLDPVRAATKRLTAEKQALKDALDNNLLSFEEYGLRLRQLDSEYEQNTRATTQWTQWTESSLERVDSAFADAWRNIGDGFSSFRDSLTNAFKQMLAELAHMAITKPIIMQIGAAMGIGGGTQGNNGIWGSLLGGRSASGASGGIGGALQAANQAHSLYSMYGSAQSLLPILQGGYASGGMGGALGGVGSYLGGFIGGSGAAASSAAGSVASGYTGSAYASWAAGQGTGAVGGGMFSGLGGMASAWPLAVLAGIWQSGKLYDQGVRPSASDMWASTQGNALGKIGNVAPTLMSGFYKGLDSILEPVVGGKLAAMITGSTFHQALWGGINKKLFGGAWQTKDYGIGLGIDDGMLDAGGFEYRKKKGGLFSSSKKKTIWRDLDPEVQAALDETYAATADGVFSLFESLSYTIEDNALAGLNMARKQISTQGKTEEEIQEAIGKWFGKVADSMTAELQSVFGTGLDYDFAGMQAFVANLQGVNEVLRYLDVGMYDASVAGGKLAEALSAAAGGLDALAANSATYYDAFFSAEEKTADTIDSIKRAFESANVELAASREAYRAMVEDIDLTTEAGQQMFATLMALSGQAAQYFSIVEQQAAQAAAAQAQLLVGNVNSAYGQLQRSIAVERDRLTRNYHEAVKQQQAASQAQAAAATARAGSLADMVATSQSVVQSLHSLDKALGSALDRLLGNNAEYVESQRSAAVQLLNVALTAGRSGKSIAGFEGLEDALAKASELDPALYGSFNDFQREQGRTANLISELQGINGKQLTAGEKLLEQLQANARSAQASASALSSGISGVSSQLQQEYDAAIAALDEELAAAQSQIDALNGIDNSVLTVAAAVAQMSAAVTAAINAQAGTTGNSAMIDQLYKSILGSGADSEGQRHWQEALANGQTYTDLVRALKLAAGAAAYDPASDAKSIERQIERLKWQAATGVPAFATGGMHSGGLRLVGENGPELEVTGPSRIYSAADTAAMLKGGGENAAEMRAMRKELADLKGYLYQITKNTGRTSESLRNIEEGAVLA